MLQEQGARRIRGDRQVIWENHRISKCAPNYLSFDKDSLLFPGILKNIFLGNACVLSRANESLKVKRT